MSDINYHVGAGCELQRQRDDALNRLAHVAGEAHSLRLSLAAAQKEMQQLRDELAKAKPETPAAPA